eukprot:GAHX01001645.1.p1 GENE.GAHX01001645.1~~GAHX01001645.1.p1  ORF type:complete len:113 (+),score=21.42 GAHX01001645.1:53-391(+)
MKNTTTNKRNYSNEKEQRTGEDRETTEDLERLEKNVDSIKSITYELGRETDIHNEILKEIISEQGGIQHTASLFGRKLDISDKGFSRLKFSFQVCLILFLFYLLIKIKRIFI